ncbi:MAG: lipopolysaccharide biosynthesis protein, partial [Chloroflexota bacterium]
ASAAVSGAQLLGALSTLGLGFGLIRFLPAAGPNGNRLVNSCFTVSGLVSMALAGVFLLGLHIWSPPLLLIRRHPVFVAAFVLLVLGTVLYAFIRRVFVARRRAGLALVQQGVLFGLVRFVPLIALVGYFRMFGIFAAWEIALGASVAVGLFLLLPRVQKGYRPLPTIDWKVVRDIMPFAAGNYAAHLFWMLPGLALPLVVVGVLGAEANAYFYVGWAAGSVLFTVPEAASLSMLAEGATDTLGLPGQSKRSLRFSLLVLLPVALIMFFLADEVLWLFGRAYSENAADLLRVMAVSSLPVSVNHVYFGQKRVRMETKEMVVLATCVAVVTLSVAYFLLPVLGLMGAGLAWFASQTVASLCVLPHVLRLAREA